MSKMKIGKIIALLLVILLGAEGSVFSVASAGDAAIVCEGTCSEEISWTLDREGTLTLKGRGAIENFERKEAPWYPKRDSIKKIVICDGVTVIGRYAFCDCRSLLTATIPKRMMTIGAYAFGYCADLQLLYIPYSVTTVEEEAFHGCNRLKVICVEDSTAAEYVNYHYMDAVFLKDEPEDPTEAVKAVCPHTKRTYRKVVKSTCTKTGLTEGTECFVCGKVIKEQQVTAKKAHSYQKTVTKATTKKAGSVVVRCAVCGKLKSKKAIPRVKTVKLSDSSFIYNGKVRKPTVVVRDSKKNALKKGTDFTVKYSDSKSKKAGKYTVTVTLKGKYSGKVKLAYTIAAKKSGKR